MGYRKHNNFISYGRKGTTVNVEVKDETERVIYKKFCQDKKSYAEALKVLDEKFGFSPEIDVEDSPNFHKEKGWFDKDSEW